VKTIVTAAALAAVTALAAGCSAASTGSQQPGQAAATAAPFTITPVHCGPYDSVQRSRFADYGGLIFTYKNVSGHRAAVLVRVNFVHGSNVIGSNVTAYEPVIRPGQTGTAEVGYPASKMPAGVTCQVTAVGAQ
jgi:hypothetical protein